MTVPSTLHRFVADDGVGLVYREWGAEHASNGRPPVVLHHGFLVDAVVNWELPGIVDLLVGAGHRVIAIDARGHGRSDKPHDPARYGESHMAADLHDLFDHLGLDDPGQVGQMDLVGYSMGAVVALVAASTSGTRGRIRRLVVGGVGGAIVRLGGVDRAVLDPSDLAAALRAPDPSALAAGEARNFRMAAEQFGNDLEALACQAEAVHRSPIDLAAITAPTLVIVGRDDHLAREPELLVDAIPDASLTLVEGDHMSAVSGAFATHVVDHLAGPT